MIKHVLFFIHISFAFTFAQEFSVYHKLLKSADNLAYNFQFDSSQSIINRAIKLKPGRPEAYQLLSKIYLWYSLGSKDENNVTTFFAYSDSAIKKTDYLLNENSEEKNALYILGNIYKYRAMVYGAKGNTLDAFWSTKKAVSFFEDVISLDSTFYSAYGGIGIFEYALSYVPALFDWALTISGLTADKKNGFDLIEQAYKKGNHDKIEYQFHLAKLLDEYYAEYKLSARLLKKLVNEYPQNSLFHYQLAIEYIKLRDLEKAEKELNTVLEINNPKFVQTNSFSFFLLGDIYYRKNNWEEAKDYYLKFIQTTETIDYTGIASLRTAYCYYFLGEENMFRRYLLLAANGNHDIEDDSFANEISEVIITEGISEENEILIKIENAFLSGNDKLVLELSSKIDSLTNPDIIAEVYVYKSSSLLNLNKLPDAKIAANNFRKIKVKKSSWIKPFSLYNLALIKFKEKDYKTAEELLSAAEEVNIYRKQNLIQSYINNLNRQIENESKLVQNK